MRSLVPFILLLLSPMYASPQTKLPPWHQVLNRYVDFISHAAEETESRMLSLKTYYAAAEYYRDKGSHEPRLASSGSLKDYYYQTARRENGSLTPAEIRILQLGADRLWQAAVRLDEKCKELETYVRLKDYQQDGLRQSDALLHDLEGLFVELNREKESLWRQIETVYGHYHPAASAEPGLQLALAMRQVLESEKTLLDAWPIYFDETRPAGP